MVATRKRSQSPAVAKKSNSNSVSVKSNKTTKKSGDVEYEFGGPIGATATMVFLPILIHALYFLCNDKYCLNSPMSFNWNDFQASLPASFKELYCSEATYIFLGWMAFQLVMQLCLPGEVVEGTPVAGLGGKKLSYCMSGHLQFWLSLAAIAGYFYPVLSASTATTSEGVYSITSFAKIPLEKLYDNYTGLIIL